MKYRENYRIEPGTEFEPDIHPSDAVILIIGIIAVVVAVFQPEDIIAMLRAFTS